MTDAKTGSFSMTQREAKLIVTLASIGGATLAQDADAAAMLVSIFLNLEPDSEEINKTLQNLVAELKEQFPGSGDPIIIRYQEQEPEENDITIVVAGPPKGVIQ